MHSWRRLGWLGNATSSAATRCGCDARQYTENIQSITSDQLKVEAWYCELFDGLSSSLSNVIVYAPAEEAIIEIQA
jgi:hypothetical protein